MIKLKDLLSEEFNHPVYGSHKTNFLVKRPFDVFIKTGLTWNLEGCIEQKTDTVVVKKCL